MTVPLSPLPPISPLKPLQDINAESKPDFGSSAGADFSSALKNAINSLEKTQQEASQAAADLVTGKSADFHTPVIAMEKAALTMDLAVSIRNKVLEAYHEIMRMQI